jgi:hypothetical protein
MEIGRPLSTPYKKGAMPTIASVLGVGASSFTIALMFPRGRSDQCAHRDALAAGETA